MLKLRLVVARFGEMDVARWWNTKGQLGRLGALALTRGFPRTHHFAQARSVFAVARERCREIFDAPESVTLWRLPADVEDEFDLRWEQWLDEAPTWRPFFERLHQVSGADLAATLRAFELADESDLAAARALRTAAEGRAVPLPGTFTPADANTTLLALGFACGEPNALAVPYMRQAAA